MKLYIWKRIGGLCAFCVCLVVLGGCPKRDITTLSSTVPEWDQHATQPHARREADNHSLLLNAGDKDEFEGPPATLDVYRDLLGDKYEIEELEAVPPFFGEDVEAVMSFTDQFRHRTLEELKELWGSKVDNVLEGYVSARDDEIAVHMTATEDDGEITVQFVPTPGEPQVAGDRYDFWAIYVVSTGRLLSFTGEVPGSADTIVVECLRNGSILCWWHTERTADGGVVFTCAHFAETGETTLCFRATKAGG